MTELWFDILNSPLGEILLITDDRALCALDFADVEPRLQQNLKHRYSQFSLKPKADPHGFSSRIRAYLQGDYDSIEGTPVRPGGTAFQQQVWTALQAIPVGQTLSYRELATKLGKPTASRAVGLASSLNPIAIVIPCHRVIGANGALTGYAGGLERKKWLLEHEGVELKRHSLSVGLN